MNINTIPTPSYVVDEDAIEKNLKILQQVEQRTGAKVLLAQKAFSLYQLYPFIGQYISGTTASGLYEARLGKEEMPGKQVHVYAPAYKEADVRTLAEICDHIVFNSPGQWERFGSIIMNAKGRISVGIRLNPEYAEIETDIYNPCFTGSRLGTTLKELEKVWKQGEKIENTPLKGIEGLHFHAMCEQGADVLERILDVVMEKFDFYLKNVKWLNLGGGHHITRTDYDLEKLIAVIEKIQKKYGLMVYIEPGEAVALNGGILVSTVLETLENGMKLAILDTSAACHMPDVLEMPYRPAASLLLSTGELLPSGIVEEKKYTYRFGGPTCLAGDIIGDYSFDRELEAGDRIVFYDMAIYSMVKNNTFNGMPLPSIARMRQGKVEIIKTFGYEDFKGRL